jgi:hypothetical protein
LEDVATCPKRRMGLVLGVPWLATSRAWLAPFVWMALGTFATFVGSPARDAAGTLARGAVFGLMLYGANLLHSIGHLVAGVLVMAPMSANLLTATRDVNIYETAAGPPPARWARVARTMGGPLANAGLGLACVLVAGLGARGLLSWFGFANLAVAFWTIMPLPTLDGSDLWVALLGPGPGGRIGRRRDR